MQRQGYASKSGSEPVSVNPIPEFISSGVSALPAGLPIAPPVTAQGAPGGFALTLAAAKSAAAPSPAATSEQVSEQEIEGAPNLNLRTPSGGLPQSKKSNSNLPTAAGAAVSVNSLVPGFAAGIVPTAVSVLPLSSPLTNLSLFNFLGQSPSQASFPSTQSGPAAGQAVTAQTAEAHSTPGSSSGLSSSGLNSNLQVAGGESPIPQSAGAGVVPPSVLATSYTAAARSASEVYSIPPLPNSSFAGASTGVASGLSSNFEATPAPTANTSEQIPDATNVAASYLEPSAHEAAQNPSSSVEKISFTVGLSNTVPSQSSAGVETGRFSAPIGQLPTTATAQVASRPLPGTSIAAEPSASSTILASAAIQDQDGGWSSSIDLAKERTASAAALGPVALEPVTLEPVTLEPVTTDSATTESALETQAGESVPSALTLLASAIPETVSAGLPVSSIAITSALGQPNSSTTAATALSEPVAGNGPAEIVVEPNSALSFPASSVLNTASPVPSGKAPRIVAPAAGNAASSSGVRTAGAVANPATAKPTASLTSESDNDYGVSLGQTPFSVFFSDAGSAPQSAAVSTLPHLILPSAGSGFRESHSTSAAASSATSQTAASQSDVAQNSASPNGKESLAPSDSTGSSTAQTLHRDADLNLAANAPLGSVQTGPAAAPASTGITVALGTAAAVSGDSVPKPETLPGTTNGNPANLTAPLPQPVAAAPGPVQMAQMVNRAETTEMRIGMNTSAFGSVEVRTVVHASDVGMTIGSEKGDLRGMLANDLPGISNALQQQNLRLTGVNFTQGFASSNNSSGGGGDSQQRSFVPARPIATPVLSEAAVDDSPVPVSGWEPGGGMGLSILA